ncbi:hypothetical protein ACOMHN_056855 [Nucella lapillus]
MSDVEAWDADDFEPELPALPVVDDKWQGEDEEDTIKDNWEDEDEEDTTKTQAAGAQQSGTQAAYQRPKKKSLTERIAEKEALKSKEKEEQKNKAKEEKRELSTEEKLVEKIRIQKIQEQDSLNLAKGLFGVQEHGLDSMLPITADEFDQFRDALKSRISLLEGSPHYQALVCKLISDLAVGLGIEEVKKLGISLNSLYYEKERRRKETEKKKKKKSKVNIKVDRADDFDFISDATGGGNYYDDDEFI